MDDECVRRFHGQDKRCTMANRECSGNERNCMVKVIVWSRTCVCSGLWMCMVAGQTIGYFSRRTELFKLVFNVDEGSF